MSAPVSRLAIARRSLLRRWLSVSLTVLGIAVSVAMILAVERIRLETRENFTQTVAGTDLIVGSRTSPVQLLLYSVFRIGDATANIRYASFEKISRHPQVRWAVPLSLGDSHRGFRVVGTSPGYFEHLRVAGDRSLDFASGSTLSGRFDAVLGAAVARSLGYALGAEIVVAHGTRDDGLSSHEALPFEVVGILAPTGSPVDQAIYVGLEAIEAIHIGWESGTRVAGSELDQADAVTAALEVEAITAFFLGLERRSTALQFQRAVNGFPDEPLTAILPGVALNELWRLFGSVELALLAVAVLTVVTGLIGMVVGLLSTLSERRREMAVLRALGAHPLDLCSLLLFESALIALAGALIGYGLLTLGLAVANPLLATDFGVSFSTGLPTAREGLLLGAVVTLALVAALLPAWQAYRLSLRDGLHAGV